MIIKEFDNFYINYNIGINPVYRNVKIQAETWEEARKVAESEINRYIEKQRLYCREMAGNFKQVGGGEKNY
jgi:hypothetical protein